MLAGGLRLVGWLADQSHTKAGARSGNYFERDQWVRGSSVSKREGKVAHTTIEQLWAPGGSERAKEEEGNLATLARLTVSQSSCDSATAIAVDDHTGASRWHQIHLQRDA